MNYTVDAGTLPDHVNLHLDTNMVSEQVILYKILIPLNHNFSSYFLIKKQINQTKTKPCFFPCKLLPTLVLISSASSTLDPEHLGFAGKYANPSCLQQASLVNKHHSTSSHRQPPVLDLMSSSAIDLLSSSAIVCSTRSTDHLLLQNPSACFRTWPPTSSSATSPPAS